ncbi:MAG: hypothetical protein ACI4B5_06025 [Bacteroidaceae bacterium]
MRPACVYRFGLNNERYLCCLLLSASHDEYTQDYFCQETAEEFLKVEGLVRNGLSWGGFLIQ